LPKGTRKFVAILKKSFRAGDCRRGDQGPADPDPLALYIGTLISVARDHILGFIVLDKQLIIER
jgi:hypothetical protein